MVLKRTQNENFTLNGGTSLIDGDESVADTYSSSSKPSNTRFNTEQTSSRASLNFVVVIIIIVIIIIIIIIRYYSY